MNRFLMFPNSKVALQYDDTVMALVVSDNPANIEIFRIENISDQQIKVQYLAGELLQWMNNPTAQEMSETAGFTVIIVSPMPAQ